MPKLTWEEAQKFANNPEDLLAILVSGQNPDGSAFTLNTASVAAATEGQIAYATGRAYAVGTGRQNLTAAGNVRILLTNPAGSATLIKVVFISSYSTVGALWETFFNPTAGLPVTAIRPRMILDQRAAAAVNIGELRSDSNATTALSGGTDTGLVIPNGAGRENEVKLDLPLVVTSGQTLGVNGNFAGATDAVVNLIAYEVAV